jgi:hypothetical protein
MADQAAKICVVCGLSCAGMPRTKDPKGRYYHNECYEQRRHELEAKRSAATPVEAPAFAGLDAGDDEGFDPFAGDGGPEPLAGDDGGFDPLAGDEGGFDPLGEEAASPTMEVCPKCANPVDAGAVLCTNCGHNFKTGEHAVAPPPTASEGPSLHARMAHKRQTEAVASDTVRAEYIKPLVLLAVGSAGTFLSITSAGASLGALGGTGAQDAAAGAAVGATLAVFVLIWLVIASIATAAIYWLAAKTWLGDLGPAHLILLRVMGITSMTFAAFFLTMLISVAGTPLVGCFGLIATAAVHIGLTMWLFDISFWQVVLLGIFVSIVDAGLGFVIGMLSG